LKNDDVRADIEMDYYMKRADAYIQLKMYMECINDCDAARILVPSNLQSYMMSANAMF